MDALNRLGYFGPRGTFTEAAALQVAQDATQMIPYPSIVLTLDALAAGQVDAVVIPIENSVEGGVPATLDALAASTGLGIVREILVPIRFVLATSGPASLDSLKTVASHAHAHAQSRNWFARNLPDVTVAPANSTAAAAQDIARDVEAGKDVTGRAALCSPIAASTYGLTVIAEDVQDFTGAITRFVMVAPEKFRVPPTGADKTTLVVHLPHNRSGALMDMLEQFVTNGVNLSRIESRPIGDSLGRYSFSLDVEGHIEDRRVTEALIGVKRTCPAVVFLGSYPRADGTRVEVAARHADAAYAEARAWVDGLK